MSGRDAKTVRLHSDDPGRCPCRDNRRWAVWPRKLSRGRPPDARHLIMKEAPFPIQGNSIEVS